MTAWVDRRSIVLSGLAMTGLAGAALAAPRPRLVVYKSPSCGCCRAWSGLMTRAGFDVEIHDTDDLGPVRRKAGISPALSGCHTAFVGGYVVEGHVPPEDVVRLLKERPAAIGLTVPGMPMGAPGMETQGRHDAFNTLLVLHGGASRIFARHV